MQNLFSYPLKVEDISGAEKVYRLKATEEQCAFIAEVYKLPSVKSFQAEIHVKMTSKQHKIDVWGTADAKLEQTSVISLENFIKPYHSEFKVVYDTQMTLKELKETEFEFDDEIIDIIEIGQIDLAEIAMEQIALVIDDFPRQENESFVFKSEFDEETTRAANPFAVLQKLKK